MELIRRLPWRLILTGLTMLVLVWQLGAAGIFYAKHNWSAIRFEYPVDYAEGPLLDQAVRLARFENIYHNDLSKPPYTISNYPPLFVLVQVPFVWLFGPALWYGRLISTLSMIAAAVFLGLTLYTTTRDRWAGILGGSILLAFPYVLFWSALNRIDSLALGLICAGLYVVARWSKNRKEVIASAILLSLAVYTRQSYALAAPLASFVWLLREPPRRLAIELAAWTAGLCLGLFLLLNALTRGGFFLNVVTANVNPFFWENVKLNATGVFHHLWPFLAGSALFLVLGRLRADKTWFLVAPFLIGAFLSGMTIGKEGSNVNYLLELTAAFSLVAGSFVAWTKSRPFWRGIVLLALALQVNNMVLWSKEEYSRKVYGRIAQTSEFSQLKLLIHNATGPVLVDEHMALVPLDGRDLFFQPFEYKMLSKAGIWNQRSFVVSILNKEYALILLYAPPNWNSIEARWTPEQLWAIEYSYVYSGRLANTLICTPR